jgi:hypothetical protein
MVQMRTHKSLQLAQRITVHGIDRVAFFAHTQVV